MSAYYTATMALAIVSALSMLVCINTSGTLSRSKKKYFTLLFVCVALSAFCEWFGIYLQGTGKATQVLHIIVKAVELSIAPALGFLIAAVIDVRNGKIIIAFLLVHALVEALSGIFGFIYAVDTDSNYTHQSLYWIYAAAYAASILYAMYIIVLNMKRYQYNGVAFILMIAVCLLFGIVAQMCNSELKVVYSAVTVAAIMLYVFTLEMIQQTDELTGLINRRGYENYTSHIEDPCVILVFDIDKFKSVNDEHGHQAGDLCLRNVGAALIKTYARYGRCFRTGGDEFCAVITKGTERLDEINKEFVAVLNEYRSKNQWLPYVSFGYVYYDPTIENIQDALKDADYLMYQYKNEHYNRIDSAELQV